MSEPPLIRLPSRSWLRITLLVLGTIALIAASALLIVTSLAVNLVLLLPAALVLITFWMLLLRGWTLGTYASARGIAVQRLFGTHLVRWPEVSSVDDTDDTVVLTLGDGRTLATHIARRGIDLLGDSDRYAAAKAELARVGMQS